MLKLGVLFPGQGSQTPGMGKQFIDHTIGKETFEEANDALGWDLRKLCFEGTAEELALTHNAQPAILTVSTIAWRILTQEIENIKPYMGAGHSLGEYSALVAADVLSFSEAVKAVHLRGKFMQEAFPSGGAMAAILGKTTEEVEAVCKEEAQDQVVAPANYNCKGQIVISGHEEAVKRVLAKVKGIRLPVSAPFHSALIASAAEKLEKHLATLSFQQAKFPIVANFDNAILEDKNLFVPSLVKQLTGSVRWQSGIELMLQKGVDCFIECGQGKVLSGIMKKIDKQVPIYNLDSLDAIQNITESVTIKS